jgi:predicted metalloprotease with PDZ domain
VTEVDPGSPAEAAGIRPNDVVFSVAGKKFKRFDDYLDATAKAAATPTYPVEFMRDGKSMKVTVTRAFRPDWSEAVVAEPAKETPSTFVSGSAAPSVADELAKLAKLRDDGVLTNDEFEAQKKKLLGM